MFIIIKLQSDPIECAYRNGSARYISSAFDEIITQKWHRATILLEYTIVHKVTIISII